MSTTEETWARYASSGPITADPWHLMVATFPEGERRLTACGVDMDLNIDLESQEGMPEIAEHGPSFQEGFERAAHRCHLCYQVHLARLGIDLDDEAISEDYEPNSNTVRAATEGPGGATRWQQKSAFDRIMAEGLRPFGPKSKDHPSVGNECPACFEHLRPGEYTTLVPLGPGGSLDDRQKAVEGRPYNAVAVEVHWSCATGLKDEVAETFIEYQEKVESEHDQVRVSG